METPANIIEISTENGPDELVAALTEVLPHLAGNAHLASTAQNFYTEHALAFLTAKGVEVIIERAKFTGTRVFIGRNGNKAVAV